jgi:two-component system cell cycle response regulator CtrA
VDVDARLEALEMENGTLRIRIAELEDALMGTKHLLTPVEWQLTGSEIRVFGVLQKRELVTKEAAMAALYGNFGKDEAEIKIVDVFICKLRRKLKPFGIEIKTVWGQGYMLTAETRAKLRESAREAA